MIANTLVGGKPIFSGSPRVYLAIVFLVLLMLGSVLPAAILMLAHGGVTKRATASTRFIYFLDKKKQEISDASGDSRLVLIGGSSAFFGVRAKTLQAELGVPVINDALHAGLGTDYLLYRAKKVLRPGDTAVLFLEYSLYFKDAPEWTLADYSIPHDLAYFSMQTLSQKSKLLRLLRPMELGARLMDAVELSPSEPYLNPQIVNSYGDVIRRGQANQTDAERKQIEVLKPMSDAAISPKDAETIEAFVHWCRGNGIAVIAGSPAFLDAPSYHFGEAAAFFDSIEHLYAAMNVPVLGHPSDFFFPKSKFADTEYHLNGEGATEMTDKVGRALAGILQSSRNSMGYAYRFRTLQPEHLSRPVVITFANGEMPLNVDSLSGFAEVESWGRWTEGANASIVFSKPLPAHFRIDLLVRDSFGVNAQKGMIVRVGNFSKLVVPVRNALTTIDVVSDGTAGSIEIAPAEPQSDRQLGLGDDARLLGVGLSQLVVTPLDAPAT
jgi:hypothetical protein